jgi:methylenetetrahydrofolate reductase (NADPH)
VSVISFRRRAPADAAGRLGLARALAEPTFEVLPVKSAEAQVRWIPPGTWVSVTASPSKGLEATVDLAIDLEARGYRAIAHLSARMVRDRAHLRELLTRMLDGGVDRAFVVGGDSAVPGAFPDGLSLLREIADLGVELSNVGIPCYPQGHAFIPDDALLEALAAKAPFAHYMTTQLCFDASAIASWIAARRADGFTLPVQIGVAGAVEPHRLLAVSARIGVRDTGRFLLKNAGFVARLLRSGGFYRPDSLLDQLAPLYGDPVADVRWVHLYTFNQVETTEAWRRRYVARLAAPAAQPA